MSYVVLCVDPDDGARSETVEGLEAALADVEITFEGVASLDAAEGVLTDRAIDCVVTEYDLPDGTGLDLFDRTRERSPDTGCVLFTDASHEAIDTDAFGETIAEYVRKGSDHAVDRLARLVRTTITTTSQASYPLPQNEAERRATLRSYDLDSEDLRETLQRITDLAGAHFEVPSASVNVIHDHSQEFLACHGDAVEWSDTHREDSICTFTILEADNTMRVPDVSEDPRFENKGTLDDLGIRAYLGANLVSPGGFVIGTLCVYDDEPRSFSDEDAAYLRELAELTMDVIELHYRLERVSDAGEGVEADEIVAGGRDTPGVGGGNPEGDR